MGRWGSLNSEGLLREVSDISRGVKKKGFDEKVEKCRLRPKLKGIADDFRPAARRRIHPQLPPRLVRGIASQNRVQTDGTNSQLRNCSFFQAFVAMQ